MNLAFVRWLFWTAGGFLLGSVMFSSILPKQLAHVDVAAQSPDRKSSIARQPVSTAGIQSHSSTTAHASRRSRSEPRSRCRTFDQKHSDE